MIKDNDSINLVLRLVDFGPDKVGQKFLRWRICVYCFQDVLVRGGDADKANHGSIAIQKLGEHWLLGQPHIVFCTGPSEKSIHCPGPFSMETRVMVAGQDNRAKLGQIIEPENLPPDGQGNMGMDVTSVNTQVSAVCNKVDFSNQLRNCLNCMGCFFEVRQVKMPISGVENFH